MRIRTRSLIAPALWLLLCAACSAADANRSTSRPSEGEAAGNEGGGGADPAGPAAGVEQGGADGITLQMPESGTAAAGGAGGCGDHLNAAIRDFTEAHPDFEHFLGNGLAGIVKPELGSDGTPVYAASGATAQTSGPAQFAQWYHNTPGVNVVIPYRIQFVTQPDGVQVYDNQAFFPIDGKGLGNGPKPLFGTATHNFLFTSQIRTSFTYSGGEVFTFSGDDDLWIFINKKLAIDLGGVHPSMAKTIDMDVAANELSIVKGSTYPMDIFQAERHTNESHFRIETTIRCFTEQPVN